MLALEIAAQPNAGDTPVGRAPHQATTAPQGAPAPTPDQAGQWASVSLARPLFMPGRRPPAPGARDQAAPPGTPELSLRLAGVMIGPFGKSVIFAAPDGGKPIIVSEGQKAAGYTVLSIEAGKVTVRGPHGSQVLRPTFAPQTGTGQPRNGAPPPPR